MTDTKARQAAEALVDETLAQSFPASDPPSWTLGVEDVAPASEDSGPDELGVAPRRGGANAFAGAHLLRWAKRRLLGLARGRTR